MATTQMAPTKADARPLILTQRIKDIDANPLNATEHWSGA
jgi:hypothetical protein